MTMVCSDRRQVNLIVERNVEAGRGDKLACAADDTMVHYETCGGRRGECVGHSMGATVAVSQSDAAGDQGVSKTAHLYLLALPDPRFASDRRRRVIGITDKEGRELWPQ